MKTTCVIILLCAVSLIVAWMPEKQPVPAKLEIPEGWPAPNDIFKDNPPTKEGFLLGKKLFYDGRLSRDGKFPCASCHEPRAAFATFDHDFSHGFNGQFTTRNAPSLANLAWQPYYNWDGKFKTLEEQAVSPITAPNEMAENIDSVLIKLRKDKEYPVMFKKAFGKNEITEDKLLKALAQFTGMMVSANSKYDRVMKRKDAFNSAEQSGYRVFKQHCETCHKEPLFSDYSFRNNGLGVDPEYMDVGRMDVTGRNSDSLKFKVPSLRNVALTAPYMHDGRFSSVSRVIEFYADGIQQSPTLDPSLRKPLNLSAKDKFDLAYFLRTLTDSSFITNPAYLR